MNILVIGNGFDLAHELPTTYQDFLKFTDNYRSYLKDDYYEQMLEVKKLVTGNTWIKHFKRFYECNGWIGFEMEISRIIQLLGQKIPKVESLKEKEGFYLKIGKVTEQDALKDFVPEITKGMITDKDFISKTKKIMLNDLERLIRCFEIYLTCHINQLPVNEISPDIQNLCIDKVLSFNYTDTYERIYDSLSNNNIEYDFVHGKADINNTIESNNMVLGIDEYLEKDKRNKDIGFIAFKKYYQRIYKGTGNKYKDWVNQIKKENRTYKKKKRDCKMFLKKGRGLSGEIEEKEKEMEQLKENPPRHNLYIFGHSLDITDRDILRDLILHDYVHTTIFYHEKDVMGQQIANLVKVIGQDELIRRTGGSNPLIEFKPQKKKKTIEK